MMKTCISNGAGKGNNVVIAGPKSCGKSLLVAFLANVFTTMHKPATTKASDAVLFAVSNVSTACIPCSSG